MKNVNYLPIIILTVIILFTGCNNINLEVRNVDKAKLSGKAQKGPFTIGSKVTIFELDKTLSQTGKVFTTTIIDKDGSFEQRNMKLNSQYVELFVDGHFFNEVKGITEQSSLTLSAITDLSDVENVNINILTTIERPRILYLIENKGLSFAEAREQAHNEVLSIFGFGKRDIPNSEELSLNNNSQLLAISSIVMGTRTISDITSLITSIATDIQKDGLLDDESVKSALRTNFAGLDASEIIKNMKVNNISLAYSGADLQDALSVFDKYSGEYAIETIEYPQVGNYGKNILACADGSRLSIGTYSFASQNGWAPLKVVLTSYDVEWYMNIIKYNWDWTTYISGTNGKPNSQIFTVVDPSVKSDLQFIVNDPGRITFTFYEFGSETPTKEKTITFVKQ